MNSPGFGATLGKGGLVSTFMKEPEQIAANSLPSLRAQPETKEAIRLPRNANYKFYAGVGLLGFARLTPVRRLTR